MNDEYAFEVNYSEPDITCTGCGLTIDPEKDARYIRAINKKGDSLPYHQNCIEQFGWSVLYFVTHYKVDDVIAGGIN